MNFIGDLRSRNAVFVFLQFFIMLVASVMGFAPCSSSSFSRYIGYILRGFLLAEVEVGDIMECEKRCIISANCLSLNILTNADGRLVCQLNSGLKENGVREQFVQHGAGEYYGLKAKKLCNSDGKTCDNATPWYAFNQSYFQYVRNAVVHGDARAYCQEQNGGLVSISSEEEQTFLHETLILPDPGATYVVRIGMNDFAEEGVYLWEDGSPVSHIRWAPNQPNNINNEDCMSLWKVDGGFADIPCHSMESFFICETDYNALIS